MIPCYTFLIHLIVTYCHIVTMGKIIKVSRKMVRPTPQLLTTSSMLGHAGHIMVPKDQAFAFLCVFFGGKKNDKP